MFRKWHEEDGWEDASTGGWDANLVPKDRWVILEYEYAEKGGGYPCVGRWNPIDVEGSVYEFEVIDPYIPGQWWPAGRISRWRELSNGGLDE